MLSLAILNALSAIFMLWLLFDIYLLERPFMESSTSHRLMSRVAGSVILASLTIPVIAGAALAQESPFESTPDNRLGITRDINQSDIKQIIDNQRTNAVLHIHKFEGNYTGHTNDGSVQNVTGTPLAGVEFQITPITGLDVKNFDHWVAYSKLNVKDLADRGESNGYRLDTGRTTTVTTNDQGEASPTLPLGFYMVTETSAPGRTTISPYLVALPLTINDEWSYDIHTYPKNQMIAVDKTVNDAYAKSGDTIAYDIVGDVPAADPDKTFERYVIVDRQPEHITVNRDSVKVSIGNTQLAAEDFQVAQGGQARDTKITLTASGLQKLWEARKQGEVKVTASLTGTVGNVPVAGTDAAAETNTAYLYFDSAQGDPDDPKPEDPHDEVVSRFGKLDLTKINDQGTPLQGAVFQLYRCDNNTNTIVDGPLQVSGQDSWTTDDQGKLTITGLQVDDFRNGEVAEDTFDYCLVETQAPEGYELLPQPVGFSVKSAAASAALEVTNVPENGGNFLPNTGAAGTLAIIVGSAALAGMGALTMKKRNEDDAAVA